ncbi:MAG TPA: SDR family oxidoreductase [Myxococcales bacterium LLY-WYZ-16_1]|nr:SDR family oxidoreductase [Myxococcales bacterium LLY-WYZ-16_1]
MKNKRIVITGGAGEIASALALKCLNEGGNVHLVDIDEDGLNKSVQEFGEDRVSYTVADVSDGENTKMYVKEAKARWGGIDVFFDNAGIEGNVKPLIETSEEEWDKLMSINLRGMWLGLKHAAPVMIEGGGGAIVMTSSVAGLGGFPGLGPYVTSKHAVIGLMRTAALELAGQGIRVNTVNPSPVNTRMMRSIESGVGNQQQTQQQFESMIPLQRYSETSETADLMFYLATDEASFLTGGVYVVDGGMTASA